AFYDHRSVGLLRDFEFSDGDHPSRAGALRYSSVLARDVLLPMVAPEMERDTRRFSPPQPHRGCELVEDFEATSQPGWRFEGHAFAEGPLSGSTGTQRTITGFLGVQLLNSYHPDAGDTARGIALSPPFVLDRSELRLRVGGGRDPRLRVELLVDGEVLRTARGDGTEALDEVRWNVEELRGRTARLRIIDASSTRSGHILVDHVERCWPAQEDGGPLGGS
ncbi:MAG: hypothetical protein H5U40_02825, partial [Polyangiaceae bacterium]|nr:hypothetical protein [Polyangiaceae bacterium]